MSFREAQLGDVSKLLAVVNEAYLVEAFFISGPRLDVGEATEHLRKGAFLLAEGPEGLEGCVYTELRGDVGYFGLLSVAKRFQGRGLGDRLIAAAEARFRAAGCSTSELAVVSLRSELFAFYGKRGYVETGTAPFPEPATPRLVKHCHLVVMRKPLATEAQEGASMSTIKTKDGTEIYYKDWGSGPPVVFSHGWPLTADAWDAQMLFLGQKGYRVIAHDRRGHGRSSQPWNGNEMDTYADDLAALTEALDLKAAVHVGHSTGGGEVARYLGRHGTKRVQKVALLGAVPPLMLKTAANPGGLPIDVFDGIRAGVVADRSQFFKDLTTPFYGANRPGAKVSQGVRDAFWAQGMQAGHKSAYDCIKAFSETDFTEDLKRIDVPTLILHGDDDQIVPIGASALLSSTLVKGSTLKVYPGLPHGMCTTHADTINADLLAFLKG